MRELAELAAELRRAGVVVGTEQVQAATRALVAVPPADSRHALRSVLCSSREDIERFDAIWTGLTAPPPVMPDPVIAAALPRVRVPDSDLGEAPGDAEMQPSMWSDVELLLDRDFAELSDEEVERARVLVAAPWPAGPLRRSRRLSRSHRRTRRPDVQRTLRTALRNGGDPVERHWRTTTVVARPLVLVVDVSGSMAPYARMLLLYAHAAVARRRRVEVFAFGTRLTHLTHELGVREPELGLERAQAAVADWAGGTRTGESLAELTRRHGGRLGRGAVVVILSDGWDRGDPEEVDAEMARIKRVAHSVIWLNPLKARPGYEPLARGMAAALPHVDHFLTGHSLRSLTRLGEVLDTDL